jgi:D-3-phosphoglycerate dehydrogenase
MRRAISPAKFLMLMVVFLWIKRMTTPRFVAITDSPAGSDISVERAILSEMRVERIGWQNHTDLLAALRNADAIMCMHAPIDAEVIGSLERCRMITRFGTGLDNIDLEAARKAGITVMGVHDYCTEEVANHTMALLLAWNRKIVEYHQFVAQKRWNERSNTTGNWGCGPLTRLSGQALGLWGFGYIGQAVAARAAAFGLRVLAYARRPNPDVAKQLGVELVDVDTLVETSDYLSLHLPLTAETRHIINAERLARMKPGAILINTSRGGLVDERALATALRDGPIAGALLDVYEAAPLPVEHPFRQLSNLILTPHVGFFSEQSLIELRQRAARNVLNALTYG